MSYEEKHNITELFTLVIVTVPYLIYILAKYASEQPAIEGELGFWMSAFLLVIPVRIVAEIVLHILMAIISAIATGKEDLDTSRDERDYMIDLKGTRNSYYAFMISLLGAFLLAAAANSIGVLFLGMFVGGTLSELVGILSKIFYYMRGV